jgi:hypothetical protein
MYKSVVLPTGQAQNIIDEVFPEEMVGEPVDATLDRHVVSLCQVIQ